MAKDYMDSWELNGDTVLLQDFGKGKNGGVGVLNSIGKLTSSDITVIYSDKLKTSKEDPNNTPLKDWIENVTPFIATTYGHSFTPFFKEHAEITNYCPEERLISLHDLDTGKWYIDSKNRGPRECSVYIGAGFSYFVKKEEVIGSISGLGVKWCYLSDLIEHECNVTFISPNREHHSYYFLAAIKNVLYVIHASGTNNNYYVGLMTSTDGINFTEVYEHSCAYTYSQTNSSAYYNNIYVFNTPYYTITINNGEFYFSEHSTSTNWVNVYVVNGVFTTGKYWSEDGIHWTATSGVSFASNITIKAYAMFNKIMWLSNYSTSCVYTEDGKTLVAYERAPIEYEGITYHLSGVPCVDNGVAFIQCAESNNNKFALAKSTDGIHFTIVKVFEEANAVMSATDLWAGKGVVLFNTRNGQTLERYTPQKTPDTNIWLPHNPYKNYIKGGN